MARSDGFQTNQAASSLSAMIDFMLDKTTDSLMRYQYMMLQQGPRIKADYAIKVGCYENKELASIIALRRVQRKLELVQQAIDEHETIDEQAIDECLDLEFADYEKQNHSALSDYLSLLEWREDDRAITSHDRSELRRIFRIVVRRLAPEIHPDQDEAAVRLFLTAQQAYQHGDLPTLRAIEVTSSYINPQNSISDSDQDAITEAALNSRYTALEDAFSASEARIEEQQGVFPFTFEQRLENRDWVAARIEDISDNITRNDREAAVAQRRLDLLVQQQKG